MGLARLGLSLAGALAPEYSFGVQNQWLHVLAHVTIGIVVPTLLIWGVASLVRLIATKMTRRPVVA